MLIRAEVQPLSASQATTLSVRTTPALVVTLVENVPAHDALTVQVLLGLDAVSGS